MTLGHLSTSASAAGTGNLTWTHTPAGTMRGVLVLVVQNVGTTDEVTGVTYGGVALAEVAGSPLIVSTGTEDGAIYAYFLGSGIPTGAQTVTVTVSGSSTKRANLYNVSAASDTSVEDAVATDLGVAANPTATLATGVPTYICGALFSGQNAPGSITAPTDTSQTLTHDFGTQSCAWHRRSTVPIGAGSPTLGWTATAEEAGIFAVAIREGAAGATVQLVSAVLALSAQPTTPVPGPVTVTFAAATLALSAQPTTPVVTPAAVAMAPAVLALTAGAVTPLPGAVTVPLASAVLALSGRPLTPVPGPLSVALTLATAAMVAVPLTPVPGPVSMPLAPAVVAFSATVVVPTSSAGTVILQPAPLVLSARPATPAPGVVTVPLVAAVVQLAARPLTPTTPPIFVQLAPALLSLVAATVTVAGPVTFGTMHHATRTKPAAFGAGVGGPGVTRGTRTTAGASVAVRTVPTMTGR